MIVYRYESSYSAPRLFSSLRKCRRYFLYFWEFGDAWNTACNIRDGGGHALTKREALNTKRWEDHLDMFPELYLQFDYKEVGECWAKITKEEVE